MLARTDLAIVGADVVGLAHAVEALRRGLSVAIVEPADRAGAAPARGLGHLAITAQAGDALNHAFVARDTWLQLAKEAGFWIGDGGTLIAVTSEAEYAVLEEFYDLRGDQVVLLDRDDVADYAPLGPDVVGGGWLPFDLRIDPAEALPAIASWLESQGVRIHRTTTASAVEPGLVRTDRGDVASNAVVVADRNEIDRLFPDASSAAVRGELRTVWVEKPYDGSLEPAVLTGFAMPASPGFQPCPSLHGVTERLAARHPELLSAGVNLTVVEQSSGDLVVTDGRSLPSAVDERLDAAVLAQAARLLGVDRLTVRGHGRETYAAAPGSSLLVEAPIPGVRVVDVADAIRLTTAFGLAPLVLDDLAA